MRDHASLDHVATTNIQRDDLRKNNLSRAVLVFVSRRSSRTLPARFSSVFPPAPGRGNDSEIYCANCRLFTTLRALFARRKSLCAWRHVDLYIRKKLRRRWIHRWNPLIRDFYGFRVHGCAQLINGRSLRRQISNDRVETFGDPGEGFKNPREQLLLTNLPACRKL